MYEETFEPYNTSTNILDIFSSLINKERTEVVNNYLSVASSLTVVSKELTYLDADIINKKITNRIYGLDIKNTDAFDTVTYNKQESAVINDNLFSLIGQYIQYNVYENTGIDYHSFKSMTVIEKDIMLRYLKHKNDVKDYLQEVQEEEEEQRRKEAERIKEKESLYKV